MPKSLFWRQADAVGGHPTQTLICAVYPRLHRAPAPFLALKTIRRRTPMKHPRRTFLHLAAGATALTYLYPGLLCAAIALFVMQSPARADIITEWKQSAVTNLVQAQLPSGTPTRALAMLHAAMFEAVNSIDPQFNPYKASIDASKGASAAAAASSAAYRVLAAVLPAGINARRTAQSADR